jgi:hydrogenase maturation protease
VTAPLLVFGWGNASRGDDALGPLFIQRLSSMLAPSAGVECLDDYQLQVEHALDLVGRERVLFVDASLTCREPFEATLLTACRDASVTTHAVSPQALLQVFRDLLGRDAPPCTLLAIRGERFELGDAPSPAASERLDAALHWALAWAADDRRDDPPAAP